MTPIIERARQLYSLPAVAVEVLRLTECDRIDVAALKACIEKDPAISAKVLRIVNSSVFGLSGKIGDLQQALALLGIKPLKLLVLGFSLPGELFDQIEREVLVQYWRTTLTKAVAARELSQLVWKTNGDEPFLAGLLQDLGVLVLLQSLGRPYAELFLSATRGEADLRAAELKSLRFDHTTLSARLLDYWNFPERLVRAVALPQSSDRLVELRNDERALPQVLHVAHLFSEMLVWQRSGTLCDIRSLLRKYEVDDSTDLQPLVENIRQTVIQLADLFSVDVDESAFAGLLVQAQRRMALLSEDLVEEVGPSEGDEQVLRRAAEALEKAANLPLGAEWPLLGKANHHGAPSFAENSTDEQNTPSMAGAGKDARLPKLDAIVDGAVAECRRSRAPVSLALIEIANFERFVLTLGVDSTAQLVGAFLDLAKRLSHFGGDFIQSTDSQIAMMLRDCDRSQAVQLGRTIIQRTEGWFATQEERSNSKIVLSVGIASLSQAPKNFPADRLIEAASRCLFAAHSSGGDAIKSIDVY